MPAGRGGCLFERYYRPPENRGHQKIGALIDCLARLRFTVDRCPYPPVGIDLSRVSWRQVGSAQLDALRSECRCDIRARVDESGRFRWSGVGQHSRGDFGQHPVARLPIARVQGYSRPNGGDRRQANSIIRCFENVVIGEGVKPRERPHSSTRPGRSSRPRVHSATESLLLPAG